MKYSKRSDLDLQEANTILFVHMNPSSKGFNGYDTFIIEGMGQITERLKDTGYQVVVSDVKNIFIFNQLLKEKKLAGVILVSSEPELKHERLINHIISKPVPVVMWGFFHNTLPCCRVSHDETEGAYRLTQLLLKNGHTDIVFISDYKDFDMTPRYQGYLKALDEAGIESCAKVNIDPSKRIQTNKAILSVLKDPVSRITALFCEKDYIAIQVLKSLEQFKIKVPEQVAIVAVDDIPDAKNSSPPLTTARHPMQTAGARVADALLAQIQGRSVESSTLLMEPVIRHSCGTQQPDRLN